MKFLTRTIATSAIAISFYACGAVAQNTTGAPLTLRDAIRATLQHNPQLQGYTFAADALKGEAMTAALRPQLHLNAELENVAGTGELRGVDGGELTLALSSVIEFGQQRQARAGLVSAKQQQLQSTQRVLTLDVLTQVTRAFVESVAAQEQLSLLQDALELAQQNLSAISKRTDAGASPEAERLRAKAALARARIDVQHAKQQLISQQVELSAYWADVSPDFTRVKADLFALPEPVPLHILQEALSSNPDIAVLADEVRLRQAELEQARSEGRGNLEWTAGVRRLHATEDNALVVGMSMPLGSRGRASGAMATAAANEAGAQQQRDSAQTMMTAQLVSAYGLHRQAVAEVNELRRDVLPPLKQAVGATAEAFASGRYSYQELSLAQRELLEAQMALIDSAVRAQSTRIDIERITGSALTEHTEVAP